MTCTKCSLPLESCQYPLSHAHPTIDTIKLPGRANRILFRLDQNQRRGGKGYPNGLTLQERSILQNTKIYPNDFPTEFEATPWN